MKEHGHGSEDRGVRATRGRTHVARIGVLVVALVSALLMSTSTAGSQDDDPITVDIGTLELIANDVDGDGFVFNNTDGVTTHTEEFSSGGQSRLVETDAPQNLVTLEATAAGALADVGLKDHGIGVRAGRGGQRGSQITGDQTLEITLDGTPGAGATFAEFSFKAKFNSTIIVTAYDADGVVDTGTKVCDGGSDCGPDSGDDRVTARVPDDPGTTTDRPFTRVVISVSPVDGAATLIDDDASEGAETFETFFNIVEDYDGEIACDEPEANTNGDISYVFTRIGDLDEDCLVIKPYDEAITIGGPDGDTIEFEPDSSIESVYRGDLTFPAGTGAAFFDPLEYDADGPGPGGFVQMLPCIKTPVVPGDLYGETLETVFGEMGTGFYPELPTGEISCVITFDTTAGGFENSVVRLDFDPRYR